MREKNVMQNRNEETDSQVVCTLHVIKIHEQAMEVEGSIAVPHNQTRTLVAVTHSRLIPCQWIFCKKPQGEKEWKEIRYFQVRIPLEPGQMYELQFCICLFQAGYVALTLDFGQYAPLDRKVFHCYRKNHWILTFCKKHNAVLVEPQNTLRLSAYTLKRMKSLLLNGISGKKAVLVRSLCWIKSRKKQRIWLVSDRINRADDNGEAFYQYLKTHAPADVMLYFVLRKGSEGYERILQYGNVIEPFSWKHKIYHLLSEYIVSSQGNFAVVNPFGSRASANYKDRLSDQKFIFLQHGVTKDDQSSWMNRYDRNIYGLVVSTRQEYDAIFQYDYFYRPKEVWLTGMPRYDLLYHNEQSQVVVMPTWRKALSSGRDGEGVWLMSENFAKSRYVQFYEKLLNDARLLEAAERLGYQISFMPHPNTAFMGDGIRFDSRVKVHDEKKSYRDLFAESDLLVTDYSSVAFDFAYLRKPVLYCQFDKEDFFDGTHSYTKGYFDYERDGFGEVEYTLDATVNRVIEYMETGCVLKPEYRQRIEDTFVYRDQDCCRRILNRMGTAAAENAGQSSSCHGAGVF